MSKTNTPKYTVKSKIFEASNVEFDALEGDKTMANPVIAAEYENLILQLFEPSDPKNRKRLD